MLSIKVCSITPAQIVEGRQLRAATCWSFLLHPCWYKVLCPAPPLWKSFPIRMLPILRLLMSQATIQWSMSVIIMWWENISCPENVTPSMCLSFLRWAQWECDGHLRAWLCYAVRNAILCMRRNAARRQNTNTRLSIQKSVRTWSRRTVSPPPGNAMPMVVGFCQQPNLSAHFIIPSAASNEILFLD